MSTTRSPMGSADEAEDLPDDGRMPATTDEDGPHDVPDDKVIEKTLPTVPVFGNGSGPR